MPSVEYGFSEAFVETETVEYTDPETSETITDTRERECVPIRLYTRKWTETDSGAYRLWLRLTVTEFGDTLQSSGVPPNVTAPDWYGKMADDVAEWIDGIYAGDLPAQLIKQSVDADVAVESMTNDGDDLGVVIELTSDSYPVVAELTAATASFDPSRGGV